MLYAMHEAQRAMLRPWTYGAESVAQMFSEPDSWLSSWPGAARIAAAAELTWRLGKDYEKPAFGIHSVDAHGQQAAVLERVVIDKPFCRLLHFKRYGDSAEAVQALDADPTVVVVAPLSGHHATLLRDTVRTLLADHDVYITDWTDARMVPVGQGAFHLDDYIDYVREFLGQLGADRVHVLAVCQPTVPVLAAVSLMASAGQPTPRSLSLMGGPIDPSCSPTKVNNLASTQPLSWFRSSVISEVPANYPGQGRKVYPGFLQHAGFVAMNPSHHLFSHWDFYQSLLRGDQDDAETHRRFYDEYNAVLDMAAEYYLDTIDVVFQRQLLPKGRWSVRGQPVRPEDIHHSALMTIEGEHDDISGRGQTEAAQALCSGIPKDRHHSYLAAGVGHYGLFSGRRWRSMVYPELRNFIRRYEPR
ncbi:MAG TPA: polyhydroxyalkanoate depolymerase [Rhodanobacteraceae bacterium]|nr:polyhydroxyalkanoate depolymerase [Rhodanobacteraceae bacterium]